MGNPDAIKTHGAGAVIFSHGFEKRGSQLAAVIKIAQRLRDLSIVELALDDRSIHGVDDGGLQVDVLETAVNEDLINEGVDFNGLIEGWIATRIHREEEMVDALRLSTHPTAPNLSCCFIVKFLHRFHG
uniref:Uncharacterized protein n=1 Tax=Candidatus Kentrum sp. LPFa TaxID=2126335 RepID=A0A450WAN9_9GAMM|nr:MAG: hypothetical protein BECKLPF1236A_GA0070988_100999 [Candidatus Kentron sp. LPFa]